MNIGDGFLYRFRTVQEADIYAIPPKLLVQSVFVSQIPGIMLFKRVNKCLSLFLLTFQDKVNVIGHEYKSKDSDCFHGCMDYGNGIHPYLKVFCVPEP